MNFLRQSYTLLSLCISEIAVSKATSFMGLLWSMVMIVERTIMIAKVIYVSWLMTCHGLYDGTEHWDNFMILGRWQYWSLIDLTFF